MNTTKHMITIAAGALFAVAAMNSSAATLSVTASRQTAGDGAGVGIDGAGVGVSTNRAFARMYQRSGYDEMTGSFRSSTRITGGYRAPALSVRGVTLRSTLDASLTQVSMPAAAGMAPGNTASNYGTAGGSISASHALGSARITAGVGIAPWSERIAGLPTIVAPTITSVRLSGVAFNGGRLSTTAVYAHGNVQGDTVRGEGVRVQYSNASRGFTVGGAYVHGFGSNDSQIADVTMPAPDAAAPWRSYSDGISVYASAPVPMLHNVSLHLGAMTSVKRAVKRVTSASVGIGYRF